MPKTLQSQISELDRLTKSVAAPVTDVGVDLVTCTNRAQAEWLMAQPEQPPIIAERVRLNSRHLSAAQYRGDNSVRLGLYPKQRDFIIDNHRVKALTGGVGSGKSEAGARNLILRSKPKSLYMVAAPSYKMLDRATFRTFVSVATKMGVWPGEQGYYKQERRAECKNGAEYLFCSCDDPDSLRGPNASGVWMDEVQNTSEEAFAILQGRLREHGVSGWITATFTPGSPDHWTSKEFINSPNPDVAFFRAGLGENVFLESKFYEDMLRAYAASPLRIRRELEGECVYLEGAEWDPAYFEDCWFDEWPDAGRYGIKVIALDSSKGKGGKTGDYSAFVKVLFVDGLLYVDADMRNDRDASVIAQVGVEMYREWQPHYFVVEEEMGQDLLIADMHRIADEEKMVMAITPMGTDKIQKEVRIRRLTPYISRRQFRFKSNSPGAKMLVEQFMAFPRGTHDDAPDACFVAGTLISTARGDVPIEHVTENDFVLTRFGYFPVKQAGPTGIKPVVEAALEYDKSITGTANHPVFDGSGFIPLFHATELYSCSAQVSARCDFRQPPNRLHASRVVKRSLSGAPAVVYNLSVDGPPEYFANGFLVHNCEYAVRTLVKATTGKILPPRQAFYTTMGASA